MIAEVFSTSDAKLVGYAIMPNHLHLLVRQGRHPLGRTMQRLLRRVALGVQRRHAIEGHVFERRYRSQACLDPEYLRNAIVYIHLNPIRAGLCEGIDGYEWSSHRFYVDGRSDEKLAELIETEPVLHLFSRQPDESLVELRANYCQFVSWRQQMDEFHADGEQLLGCASAPVRPETLEGDMTWSRCFAPCLDQQSTTPGYRKAPVPDLRDIAVEVLREGGGEHAVHQLVGRGGGWDLSRLRRKVIKRMAAAGYQGVQIAHFLNLSEGTVSKAVWAEVEDRLDHGEKGKGKTGPVRT